MGAKARIISLLRSYFKVGDTETQSKLTNMSNLPFVMTVEVKHDVEKINQLSFNTVVNS